MSAKNEANKQIDAEEHAFELLNHYLFWEWQYCYRNDLLRKMTSEKNIKVPGVERLVSADQYIKNIVTHWPPRIIKRSMKEGLFDSAPPRSMPRGYREIGDPFFFWKKHQRQHYPLATVLDPAPASPSSIWMRGRLWIWT